MASNEAFGGDMIVVARESRGVTQKELADKLGISAAQLSRLEVDIRRLRDTVLQRKLEDILEYPREFFLQKQMIYGIGVSEVFHRKRNSVNDRTLNKIYAQIYIRTNDVSKMLRNVEIGELNIHSLDPDNYYGDASEIARVVRAAWKLPHGPIRSVTEVIENAGGIIIPFDFETDTIDAISYWPHGVPPLFFINKFSPADRIRFTLCHELGHVIMHRTVDLDSERQADIFAAEFLMPKKDIRQQLSDLSLHKLALLKQVWKVSMAALLKRATDLRQITPRHTRTIWMELGKLGYRKREPLEVDIPVETPILLNRIISAHVDDMGYSVGELSKMLCLRESEVRNIYLEPKQPLRGQETKTTIREEKRAAIREIERMLKSSDKGQGEPKATS